MVVDGVQEPMGQIDNEEHDHDKSAKRVLIKMGDDSSSEGVEIDVQHPFSVDGDSIYAKDVNVNASSIGTFTGTIISLFDDVTTVITDTTSTNPKHFTVQLKRPLKTGQINISTQTGNFSNVKIIGYDESGAVRCTEDDSANNTKYTKNHYDFAPITMAGFKIEFHTADEVNVGFNFVQKGVSVISRIQGICCDGIREDAGAHKGHLKTLGYHESIGQKTTNGDLEIERAMGRKKSIGTGGYTLLEDQTYIQPSADTQMYIQSDSADDDTAGTGAQQITIEYFSLAWGQKKTTTVDMDGITQVTLGVSDIYRIHKMYVNRGSNAAGEITLTNGDESILYGGITQYNAFMQRCIFYVAEGQRIVCTEGIFGASTSGGVIGRVFASEEDDDGNIIPRARIIFEVADSQIVYSFQISESVDNPNNKRIALGLALRGKVANQTATGSLKGFSMDIP